MIVTLGCGKQDEGNWKEGKRKTELTDKPTTSLVIPLPLFLVIQKQHNGHYHHYIYSLLPPQNPVKSLRSFSLSNLPFYISKTNSLFQFQPLNHRMRTPIDTVPSLATASPQPPPTQITRYSSYGFSRLTVLLTEDREFKTMNL